MMTRATATMASLRVAAGELELIVVSGAQAPAAPRTSGGRLMQRSKACASRAVDLAGVVREGFAELLAALEEDGIVQQGECLQRGVGALAVRAGDAGVGGVEGEQHRIRHVAPEVNVEAAAILLVAGRWRATCGCGQRR